MQQQLSGLNAALAAFAGVYSNSESGREKDAPPHERQRPSRNPPGQKARWAKVRAEKKSLEAQVFYAAVPRCGGGRTARREPRAGRPRDSRQDPALLSRRGEVAFTLHIPARLARCAA